MAQPQRKTTKETNVMFRATVERKRKWKRAAKARGETLSAFVTNAADERAERFIGVTGTPDREGPQN